MNGSFLFQIRKGAAVNSHGGKTANIVRKGHRTVKDDPLSLPSGGSSCFSHLSRPEKTLRAV